MINCDLGVRICKLETCSGFEIKCQVNVILGTQMFRGLLRCSRGRLDVLRLEEVQEE